MPEMIVKAPFMYAGVRRMTGERVEIKPRHVRLLTALRKVAEPAAEPGYQTRDMAAAGPAAVYETRDMAAVKPTPVTPKRLTTPQPKKLVTPTTP